MEKIITIGDISFPARSTAASLFSYKANFGRDAMRDLVNLAKSLPDSEDISEAGEDFELDLFYRFLWVFAKAAKPDIPPMIEWLEGFDVPPLDFLAAVLPQVRELLASTFKSNVKPKK